MDLQMKAPESSDWKVLMAGIVHDSTKKISSSKDLTNVLSFMFYILLFIFYFSKKGKGNF